MKATPSHDDLPVALRKAWNGDRQRAGLTLDAILQAALEIADHDGVAGLTLRRLGAAVGTSAMALYRHVASRDELLLLTFDFALGEPAASNAGVGWRVGLERWAQALFDRYVAHPALTELPIRGLPVTPHHSAWIEQLLVASQGCGLDVSQRLEIGLLLDAHVKNSARLAQEIISDPYSERLRAKEILTLMPVDRLPLLRDVLSAGSLQDGRPPGIQFGIRTILAGIAHDGTNDTKRT